MRQSGQWITPVVVLGLVIVGIAALKKEAVAADGSAKNVFDVYADKGAKGNHFIPSGWMGDYGDIKIDDGSTDDPADGKTCIKITYTARRPKAPTGRYFLAASGE